MSIKDKIKFYNKLSKNKTPVLNNKIYNNNNINYKHKLSYWTNIKNTLDKSIISTYNPLFKNININLNSNFYPNLSTNIINNSHTNFYIKQNTNIIHNLNININTNRNIHQSLNNTKNSYSPNYKIQNYSNQEDIFEIDDYFNMEYHNIINS